MLAGMWWTWTKYKDYRQWQRWEAVGKSLEAF
jgi:hypothetical protein